MFTGIIEEAGRLLTRRRNGQGLRLKIQADFSRSLKKGDSVAVNGCCLTVVSKQACSFEADVSPATLTATSFNSLKPGDFVNLERSLRLGDRLGGHLVQGHVDGVGKIVSKKKKTNSEEMEVSFPAFLKPYFILKGSVAVDGMSLTIQKLSKNTFTCVVIPHTLKVTHLRFKGPGDLVNLEADMLGKYVKSLLKSSLKKAS